MRRGSLESRLASLDIGLERLEALSEPPRAAAEAMGFRPGLSPDEISSLPHHTARSSSTESCAICLDSFESGAIMTSLACTHAFHRDCIHKWLSASKLCPLCKTHALDGCEDRTSEQVAPSTSIEAAPFLSPESSSANVEQELEAARHILNRWRSWQPISRTSHEPASMATSHPPSGTTSEEAAVTSRLRLLSSLGQPEAPSRLRYEQAARVPALEQRLQRPLRVGQAKGDNELRVRRLGERVPSIQGVTNAQRTDAQGQFGESYRR